MHVNQTEGHRAALLHLLEGIRLSPDEVSERLAQALDPSYWEQLNPSLSIDGEINGTRIEASAGSSGTPAELPEKFAGEGYFRVDSLLPEAAAGRLQAGIEIVRAAGWPAVFSFVYDQFWQASRTPSLVELLTSILGPGYKQTCHLWSHYVYPQKGSAGWPPHVDNPGRQDRVTVWIALTDATLDNGCLYLIPKDLVPAGIAENFVKLDSCSQADLRTLLQGARALPVRSGSVLGWGPEIIHWSSLNDAGPTQPRISISQEFVGAAATPREDELPLLDVCAGLPDFHGRLYAIGKNILAYKEVETLLIRYVDLAERLVAATGSPGS